MDDLYLIAPVPAAARQRFGEAQAALRLAQQDKPAVRGDQATIEGGAHLLARHGRQIKGKKAIAVMAGVAFSWCREKVASTTNSHPMPTDYAMSATPKSDPP
ncbi:MAG: hypothetical protein OXC14_17610 [Rhodospirillaceae bacterium]|nr:hypothetical protein [Rhodospirillaceae bacterium]